MKHSSSNRNPSLTLRIKGPVLSGIAFFSTVAVLSVGYAAYSALQTVGTASSGSQILSTEWNKMVSNFASTDSQLSEVYNRLDELAVASEYSGPKFATFMRDGKFIVPRWVSSVSVRLVGGGGGGGSYGYGGGGGGASCIKRWATTLVSANGGAWGKNARWVNGAVSSNGSLAVTPGEVLDIFVGAGGGGAGAQHSAYHASWGGGWGGGGGGWRAWGGGYGGGGGGTTSAWAAGTVCGNPWGGGGTYGGGAGTVSGGGAGYTYSGGGGWWGSSANGQSGSEYEWGNGAISNVSNVTLPGWGMMSGRGGSVWPQDGYGNYLAGTGGGGGTVYVSW